MDGYTPIKIIKSRIEDLDKDLILLSREYDENRERLTLKEQKYLRTDQRKAYSQKEDLLDINLKTLS